jgi:DNA-binding GntR family transcriptional regulator
MLLTKTLKNKKSHNDHTRLAHKGICQLLFTNEIVPGQKISYRMIAEKLGMSLTPVIQALKILEFQGFVKHTPNKGYYTEPLSLREIKEIYELREVIDLSLLPKVIENLDVENINQLKAILKKNASEEINLNSHLMIDRDFHITLSSISGRKIQIQVLQNLFDLLYLKYRGSLIFDSSVIDSGLQHQLIFDAVVTRDINKAADVMKQHFMILKDRALSSLSQILAGKTIR